MRKIHSPPKPSIVVIQIPMSIKPEEAEHNVLCYKPGVKFMPGSLSEETK